MILAVDPGKDKCGLALAKEDGAIIERRICPRKELVNLIRTFSADVIVMGKGTHHQEIEKEIQRSGIIANLILIEEKFSTLAARRLYWQENPPRGLLRFIPEGLRILPRPIDDYAAVILARRYLTLSTRAGASRG